MKYSRGDTVKITALGIEGEIIDFNTEKRTYKVRIEEFNPYMQKLEVTTKTFKEDELGPSEKH